MEISDILMKKKNENRSIQANSIQTKQILKILFLILIIVHEEYLEIHK